MPWIIPVQVTERRVGAVSDNVYIDSDTHISAYNARLYFLILFGGSSMLQILERKLLAWYVQYKLNQFIRCNMKASGKSTFAIKGIEISFKSSEASCPLNDFKIGEVVGEEFLESCSDINEMKASYEMYKNASLELAPKVLAGVVDTFCASVPKMIEAQNLICANNRAKDLLDAQHSLALEAIVNPKATEETKK
jgi:hypothetical protein